MYWEESLNDMVKLAMHTFHVIDPLEVRPKICSSNSVAETQEFRLPFRLNFKRNPYSSYDTKSDHTGLDLVLGFEQYCSKWYQITRSSVWNSAKHYIDTHAKKAFRLNFIQNTFYWSRHEDPLWHKAIFSRRPPLRSTAILTLGILIRLQRIWWEAFQNFSGPE